VKLCYSDDIVSLYNAIPLILLSISSAVRNYACEQTVEWMIPNTGMKQFWKDFENSIVVQAKELVPLRNHIINMVARILPNDN